MGFMQEYANRNTNGPTMTEIQSSKQTHSLKNFPTATFLTYPPTGGRYPRLSQHACTT
jgi:hypothetical protein